MAVTENGLAEMALNGTPQRRAWAQCPYTEKMLWTKTVAQLHVLRDGIASPCARSL